MKFTREQKAEAFDNLSKELKAVVMSDTLSKIFEEIGRESRLPVDKTGILSELVIVTMLGLMPREKFQENVINELGVDDIQASTLTNSVNEKIFLQIREILKKEEGQERAGENSVIDTVEELPVSSDLNKENILAGIENPTPAVHPISIVDQTVPGPAKPTEIVTVPEIANEFITGKMTEAVSLPTKKYSVDPYREPTS